MSDLAHEGFKRIADRVDYDIKYAHQGAYITALSVNPTNGDIVVCYTDGTAICVNTATPLSQASMDQFGLHYEWSDEPPYYGYDRRAAMNIFALKLTP